MKCPGLSSVVCSLKLCTPLAITGQLHKLWREHGWECFHSLLFDVSASSSVSLPIHLFKTAHLPRAIIIIIITIILLCLLLLFSKSKCSPKIDGGKHFFFYKGTCSSLGVNETLLLIVHFIPAGPVRVLKTCISHNLSSFYFPWEAFQTLLHFNFFHLQQYI